MGSVIAPQQYAFGVNGASLAEIRSDCEGSRVTVRRSDLLGYCDGAVEQEGVAGETDGKAFV